MTDEKILELAQRAGFSWARATDRVDGQARVWADVRDDGECIEELRKFAALVRREALEEAQWECKRLAVQRGGTQRGKGAQDCIEAIDALAAQEKSS